MSIPEPKVEHHEGRGIRSCPIFPELRPILDEAFEIFGDKSQYVVAAPVSSGRRYGDGLEELEPTHRNDATLATRRRFGLATIVPFNASQPADGTATRFPASRSLLLAWQLTTNRTAELSAGYRR